VPARGWAIANQRGRGGRPFPRRFAFPGPSSHLAVDRVQREKILLTTTDRALLTEMNGRS
jgi:hypothetical protein